MTNPIIRSKRQHPSTPIGRLLNRYAISLEMVKQCLVEEGVQFNSRTTLHRIVHGKAGKEMKDYIHPKLASCLTKFLVARGLDRAEIDEHMLAIFTEGEYQPMISQRLELSHQAIKFFGVAADPFSTPPQSRDEVFISPQLREVIDRVIDAIRYQGFVCVTGPIGSGKSTMRALIEDQVDGDSKMRIVWPEFFDMKNVSPMQIAEAILNAFDAPCPQSSIRRGRAVKELLARLYKNGVRVAIGIDEGHRLNDKALSSLKNFLEMNSGGFQRYLGVIIFAQPLFIARLREPMFQEIYERIVNLQMPEFGESAAGYLEHRLNLVGVRMNDLFDDDSVGLICSQANTPLALGNIANEALKLSMDAFKNKKVIGSAIKTKMFFENRPQSFKLRAAS